MKEPERGIGSKSERDHEKAMKMFIKRYKRASEKEGNTDEATTSQRYNDNASMRYSDTISNQIKIFN